MIVVVYTDERTYHTGTTAELNQLFGNDEGVAGIIDIKSFDENNDGKAEEINVNIGLTGVSPQDVKSIVVIQSIKYGISVSTVAFVTQLCFTFKGLSRSSDEAPRILNLPDPQWLPKTACPGHFEHVSEVCLRSRSHQT